GRMIQLFFFQAEDGIRDLIVTGVQTCALPISPVPLGASTMRIRAQAADFGGNVADSSEVTVNVARDAVAPSISITSPVNGQSFEIGRASCRERVYISADAVASRVKRTTKQQVP